jgi:hypothetical protein
MTTFQCLLGPEEIFAVLILQRTRQADIASSATRTEQRGLLRCAVFVCEVRAFHDYVPRSGRKLVEFHTVHSGIDAAGEREECDGGREQHRGDGQQQRGKAAATA